MVRTTILLNGKEYRLARRQVLAGHGARNWGVEQREIATEKIQRPDVVASKIPNEYVVFWNDWSQGVWSNINAPPGTYHSSYGIEARNPHRIILANQMITTYIPYGTYPSSADPCRILEDDGDTYLFTGRFCLKWFDGGWALEKDFNRTSHKYGAYNASTNPTGIKYGQGKYGAGYDLLTSDAVTFGNRIVVAVRDRGGDDESLWVKLGSSWSQSNNVPARFLAVVEDKLWRGYHSDVITVTSSNQDLDWNYERYGVDAEKTCVLTAGVYTKPDLADALKTAINATSGVVGVYDVSYSYENDRFTIGREHKLTIIAGTNDKLDFTEGTTGDATATLTAGTYTCAGLATHMQTQMNAAATDNTYTITYSVSTRKFTIARATGSDTIGLEWQSGPNGSGFLNTHVGTTLGFDGSADDTGATSYASDADATLFQILWKTGANGADNLDTSIHAVMGYDDSADDTGAHSYVGDSAPTFDLDRKLSQVSNCALGLDVTDSSNWSAGINVGNPDYTITAMCDLGQRLLVSKEDGLYAGDEMALFPNLIPGIKGSADKDNGKNTFVRGSEIFYPHYEGLRQILFGASSLQQEIGPNIGLARSWWREAPKVGLRISAICEGGEWIYVATEPDESWNVAGVVCLTADGGSSYTSYHTEVSDGDLSTTMPLDSFDVYVNKVSRDDISFTAATKTIETVAGDFSTLNLGTGDSFSVGGSTNDGTYTVASQTSTTLVVSETLTDEAVGNSVTVTAIRGAVYIGSNSAFYGLDLKVKNPNANVSTMNVHYWNGSRWARFESLSSDNTTVVDYTNVDKVTLSRSQRVLWRDAPSSWTTNTVNSSSVYWVRLTFSNALSATVDISEIRVLENQPYCYIMAGRPGETSYIWHTIGRITAPRISAITFSNSLDGGNCLVFAGRQITGHIILDRNASEEPLVKNSTGVITLNPTDCGMPHINKEWIDATLWGYAYMILTPSNDVLLSYRTDGTTDTEFTDVGDAVEFVRSETIDFYTELGSRPTGYRFQPRLTLSADSLIWYRPEINRLEIRFRALPTYKNHYTMYLELGDNQTGSGNNRIPDARVQKNNLEALLTTAVALVDPVGDSVTVNVVSAEVLEVVQEGLDYPVLLMKIEASEC